MHGPSLTRMEIVAAIDRAVRRHEASGLGFALAVRLVADHYNTTPDRVAALVDSAPLDVSAQSST